MATVVYGEEAAHALAGDPEALDLADASDPSRLDTLAMSVLGRILYVVSTENWPPPEDHQRPPRLCP